MVDRVNLYPIRTSNLVATCGFGFLADFKLHLEQSPKEFWKYIDEIKLWLMKNKLTNWNIFFDTVYFGQVIIYNRKLMQNANSVIYNMRAFGDSFAMDIVPKGIYNQAFYIFKKLSLHYPKLYFFNKYPSMVIFPYFNYKHRTLYPNSYRSCSGKTFAKFANPHKYRKYSLKGYK